MAINGASTEVNDGTTFTSPSYITGLPVTLRTRATTGTYYSVPAVSEIFTVRGEDSRYNIESPSIDCFKCH